MSPTRTPIALAARRLLARASLGCALGLAAGCAATVTGEELPVAEAGSDVTQPFDPADGARQQVGLAGTGTGPSPITAYTWRIAAVQSPGTASLDHAGSRRAAFFASAPGRFVLALTVMDEAGATSAPDYVTITISGDGAPVVDPLLLDARARVGGADRSARVGETVSLEVTALNQAAGEVIAWSWRLTDGPAGIEPALTGAATARASFVAELPAAEATGRFVYQVTATGAGREAQAEVTVDVGRSTLAGRIDCRVGAAACSAGAPEGSVAELGVVLDEPAGAPHTTSWRARLVSGQATVGAPLPAPGDPDSATFTLPEATGGPAQLEIVATLVVDGAGELELTARLLVEDLPVSGPPTVSLEQPTTRFLIGDVVTLIAHASDPDGDPLSCSWRVTGLLPGSVLPTQQGCGGFSGRVLEAGAAISFEVTATAGGESAVASASVAVHGIRQLGTNTATVQAVAVGPGGNVYGATEGGTDALMYAAALDRSGTVIGGNRIGNGGPVAVTPAGVAWFAPSADTDLVSVTEPTENPGPPFFDQGSETVRAFGDVCQALSVDSAGGLLAGGDNGALLYVEPDGTEHAWQVSDADGTPRIRAVLGLGRGAAFLGTREGVLHVTGLDGAGSDTPVAWDGAGSPVERLIPGAASEVWAVTYDELTGLKALYLVELANPAAGVVRRGPLLVAPMSLTDPAPVRPGAERTGPFAGELWRPEGQGGLSRVARDGTVYRLVVPLLRLDDPQRLDIPIGYRAALPVGLAGRRAIYLGTEEAFWVID